MSARVAWLATGFVLILFADHPAAAASHADSAAARAAEARALRAQIERMDQDLQTLETRLHTYANERGQAGAASHKAEANALRTQIHQMDREQELLEDRLHELEKADPAIEAERLRDPAPAAAAAPSSAPAPVAPRYTPRAPAVRQAADPAPYEAAIDTRIPMFRVAFSPYRWVPVGSRQLAVFNTYDQAYLLDFATDCPGLLSTERIRFENFATHVKAGEHAVIADGQRCLIKNIYELRISKLPKALRP